MPTQQEMMGLKVRVSSVFRAGTPIDRQPLFAGRLDQLNDVLNAALQPGRTVILFGERGVGKTSIARVVLEIISTSKAYGRFNCGTINCEETDNFDSLWRKIFRELTLITESTVLGFKGQALQSDVPFESWVPNRELNSDDVRQTLGKISDHSLIIVDDFEKLTDRWARALLADTIKNLSEHPVNLALILVGVAHSIEELIPDHHSIERALLQVRVPRMSMSELIQIINTGLHAANLTAVDCVIVRIARLAHGLPHYAHSIGLYSAFKAIESGRKVVTAQDVLEATKTTVQKSHAIQSDYNKATRGPRKQNLFAKVLRACALAEVDEFGYFPAAAVSLPMGRIMGRHYYVPNFSRHLFDLCEQERGPVLEKIGAPRRIRFRFANPMMQPFVLIHDYSQGNLTHEFLDEIRDRRGCGEIDLLGGVKQ
jgi:Cdc6-like AAA superfamily ATPase